MADLEQLKQKYAPALNTMNEFAPYGAKVDAVDLSGDQLHIKGEVEIATTGGQNQPYTIKAPDNLSKVSKLFYGDPNHYQKIAQANHLENPDKIQAGQQITVPALS